MTWLLSSKYLFCLYFLASLIFLNTQNIIFLEFVFRFFIYLKIQRNWGGKLKSEYIVLIKKFYFFFWFSRQEVGKKSLLLLCRFKNDSLLLLVMCTYVSLCAYAICLCWLCVTLTQVLEIKFGFSKTAASSFTCWAISPTHKSGPEGPFFMIIHQDKTILLSNFSAACISTIKI